MRGTNKTYSAASIIDAQGKTQYHIVPTKFIIFGLACLALLIGVAFVLGILVIGNKLEINTLKQQVVQPQENSNAEHINR